MTAKLKFKTKVKNGRFYIKWLDGYFGAEIEKMVERIERTFPNMEVTYVNMFDLNMTIITVDGLSGCSDVELAEMVRNNK